MSQFNKPTVTPKRTKVPAAVTASGTAPKLQPNAPTTTNLAGGEAYEYGIRQHIASTILNSMLKGSYYKDSNAELTQIQTLVEKAVAAGEVKFLAKAALHARHVHGLRSVSHVVAAELGEHARGSDWLRGFYRNIVFRPDDLTEILAYWSARNEGFRHPNAMIRGFADRMVKFNAYQLAKYKGDGKGVSMIDAVNLCHPRAPKDHPIHDLMKGKLAPAETWEVALSRAGQAETEEDKIEAKGEAWVKLLTEKKLGYLATLRNLRNIAEQAPAALPLALDVLMDAKQIAKSKVFPFQFRIAYDILRNGNLSNAQKNQIALAVSRAADIALANCPRFDGTTLVVVDDSGSMTSGPDPAIAKAALFAATLLKSNPNADYMQFSDSARYINLDTVGMSVFPLAAKIIESCKSGGTNFTAIFQKARSGYDRIIILSDCQGWGHSDMQQNFATYAKASKVPFLYSFDLNGSGTSMFPEKQVCLLAGFSEKIFDTMSRVESDPLALVNEIDAIDITKGIQPKADE